MDLVQSWFTHINFLILYSKLIDAALMYLFLTFVLIHSKTTIEIFYHLIGMRQRKAPLGAEGTPVSFGECDKKTEFSFLAVIDNNPLTE